MREKGDRNGGAGGGSGGAGKGREGRREEGKHGGEGRLDGWVVDGEELHEIRYI